MAQHAKSSWKRMRIIRKDLVRIHRAGSKKLLKEMQSIQEEMLLLKRELHQLKKREDNFKIMLEEMKNQLEKLGKTALFSHLDFESEGPTTVSISEESITLVLSPPSKCSIEGAKEEE